MKHDGETGRPTQFELGDDFRIGDSRYVLNKDASEKLNHLLKISPRDIPDDTIISLGRTFRTPHEKPTPFHPRIIFEAASIEPIHTRKSAKVINIKREKSVSLPPQHAPQRQIGL